MATGRIRTDGGLSQDHDPCPGPGRTVDSNNTYAFAKTSLTDGQLFMFLCFSSYD